MNETKSSVLDEMRAFIESERQKQRRALEGTKGTYQVINRNDEAAFSCGPLGDSMTLEDGRTTHQYPAQPGMSLQDWFMGMATMGLTANPCYVDRSPNEIAEIALAQAELNMDKREEAKKCLEEPEATK